MLALAVVASARAESLSPDEARAAYLASRPAPLPPGAYQRISESATEAGKRVERTYELRRAGASTLVRRETEETFSDGTSRLTRLQISNEEGLWHVHDSVAILAPPNPITDRQQVLKATMLALARGAGDDARTPKEQMLAIFHFSGEKAVVRGRTVLIVEMRLQDAAVEAMAKVMKRATNDAIKDMPLPMRLAARAMVAQQKIENQMPVRTVYEIDEATQGVLAERSYTRAGKRLYENNRQPLEPVESLPQDLFALPAGVEQVRPKNVWEFFEMQKKHRRRSG